MHQKKRLPKAAGVCRKQSYAVRRQMLTATQSFMNKEEPDDGEEEID